MAIFKCKMCGGALNIENNATVAECEYCGTKQTIPKLDDEKRTNMYDRANHFRRNNEYDKAMSIYEQILNEDRTDAEAYWSIVLCRYGIEYVEDPATKKRIPTVNRAQYTSVFADEDYKSAIANADENQKLIYQQEAAAIDKIQKGILEISQKEEPFDVFICYKETDNNGRRTLDSVLAQELYYGLKQEGFKVFFARITLEDKLGSAYEPYIFAALHSSKVMVVIGTKPEHFKAVWVKNEWSRYLSLIKKGEKKVLIPAYKDMDPYDLPEEFSHLQAQDMSKLGFMQDLVRGVKKIATATPKTVVPTVVKETDTEEKTSVKNLLRRAAIFLADGDFENADRYCEKALDLDPENGEAYLYKLLQYLGIKNKEELVSYNDDFSNNPHYRKAVTYGSAEQKEYLQQCAEIVQKRQKCVDTIQEIETKITEDKKTIDAHVVTIQECEKRVTYDQWQLENLSKQLFMGRIGASIHLLGAVLTIIFAAIGYNVVEDPTACIVLIVFLGYPSMVVGLSMMLKNRVGKQYGFGACFWHSVLIIGFDINGILFSLIALTATGKKERFEIEKELVALTEQIKTCKQEVVQKNSHIEELRSAYNQLQEYLNKLNA